MGDKELLKRHYLMRLSFFIYYFLFFAVSLLVLPAIFSIARLFLASAMGQSKSSRPFYPQFIYYATSRADRLLSLATAVYAQVSPPQ